jgi:hypothetical protein
MIETKNDLNVVIYEIENIFKKLNKNVCFLKFTLALLAIARPDFELMENPDAIQLVIVSGNISDILNSPLELRIKKKNFLYKI